jgi:hypothetical protein
MMGGNGDGEAAAQPQQPQQQPAKKRRFGIGNIIGGALPISH